MDELISSNAESATPVYCIAEKSPLSLPNGIADHVGTWAGSTGFTGRKGTLCLVPDSDHRIACALFGIGKDPLPMDTGKLARILPPGNWRLVNLFDNAHLAALGFVLGGYRFDRYRKTERQGPRLVLPDGIDAQALRADARAVFLARDLINTPANDMGPAELETAVRELGKQHGAEVAVTEGDALLSGNFPMVHAVGRASPSAPRLIDLTWGRADDPAVTLVGKGVTFDTGGLNIKPGDSMSLMKKDMGGAANVLALAGRVMTAGLPVRLRVIIGAVENSIAGNAFRPGDILRSRKGISVEIGNTDAEGRLVLADALALADEEKPQFLVDMATLTGAARVALGPDLPAMFTPDDALALEIADNGERMQDPVWRMPLWPGYRKNLSSQVADISHISKGPFAGSLTAALFLQRFVEKAACWVHFDIYGWVASEKPWATIGGEAYAIRALFEVLSRRYPPS